MFVVGKKYKGNWPGIVWTCLYTDGTNLIMQASNTGNKIHFNENEAWWTEYHEPVVVSVKRNVVSAVSDNLPVAIFGELNGRHHLGYIEFVLTDGKLTDVRIVS